MTENDSSSSWTSRAATLDADDPLAFFRDEFHIPKTAEGEEKIYLCGNSLGLMPKRVRSLMDEELNLWGALGVDGHFGGERPWYEYHEFFAKSVAAILGAKESEVVVMNSLTTNLHLLMVSFYRPTKKRFKILIEPTAFPSDRFAFQSQVRFHGFDDDAIVTMQPREGEDCLHIEDVESYLSDYGDEVALVLFGGVNYYSGHAYPQARIAKAAHDAGAICGFDLAHAAGNLDLNLHADDVDFAVFCSYKYLNAGPGGVGGAFIHERFNLDEDLQRFAGWWGTDPKTRFEMGPTFHPQQGAAGWQLSNAPIFNMVGLLASLELFDKATQPTLHKKASALSDFLLDGVESIRSEKIKVITPREKESRGCQLSLRIEGAGEIQKRLEEINVVSDYRRPDVIRIAPVPLYNSFNDVARFLDVISEI
ncbi:MAG: kynureninase [Deltaproteobacteria bacterium]|nr:kynureninase [Deltaproteobacteria bacterium]